ncbi:TetR-like C-terminal domain-containing protein [Nocardia sp. GTS18]|uniref:TetR-like C-terminal domain-containing protein n=1 Tax=Nocardia sp. GTS18 TaxID=1778064 RepID=UPI0015EF308B|nr:TetR-like C-terminal domain-containing protein [Nocardia sp. GTS18]
MSKISPTYATALPPWLGELAANIGDAIAGRSKKDALVGFATAHRAYSTEHPGRWASLQRQAGQAAVDSGAARRIVQVTDAVLLGYDIAVPDRVHATRIIGSALSGFLTSNAAGASPTARHRPSSRGRN